MDAFKIRSQGKILDYRLGKELDLVPVKRYFSKDFEVTRLWSGGRHVLGELKLDKKELFLKLATSEGIGVVTQREGAWNKAFNENASRISSRFWAPMTFASGYYSDNLYYLITDKFIGTPLSEGPNEITISQALLSSLSEIIEFSEFIQNLPLYDLPRNSFIEGEDYRSWFINKVRSHYTGIPELIRKEYDVEGLLEIVRQGIPELQQKPRHGDFAPWHLLRLSGGQLGLLDGEHAISEGIEYYDIGYFIQRVYSVLQKPDLAERMIGMLQERGYAMHKLKVVLAARGIGGFLDKSFSVSPDYSFAGKFKELILRM